ncbi:GNAT family N-acetyltransferase [Candidatus Saccharibacteria bacterium]|nr:GNAT family N-acetyltransferase [Candidatus Saccharibacteria bacterium]
MERYVISAAGGNRTAIASLETTLTPEERARFGKKLMKSAEKLNAEQAGFWLPGSSHLEMAGGEFCGNASRAVALLATNFQPGEAQLSVSGFDGEVSAKVDQLAERKYYVSADFPDMKYKISEESWGEAPAKIVDLGGIVQIVIEADLPKDYEAIQRELIKKFGLEERAAVGVVWYQNDQETGVVKIDPVVWVKEIETFFYETSCGSGSIAAALATGTRNITQPTGQNIDVKVSNTGITLASEIEIEDIKSVDYQMITDENSAWRDDFVKNYKMIFGGPPYFETYTDEEVINEVWLPSIRSGILYAAVNEQGYLVGFGCALLLNAAPKDVQAYVEQQEELPTDLPTWYFSELGTLEEYRGLGVGTELVQARIKAISEREGDFLGIMRTAATGSNSIGIYRKLGWKELSGTQDVSETSQVLDNRSASEQRVYLYKVFEGGGDER